MSTSQISVAAPRCVSFHFIVGGAISAADAAAAFIVYNRVENAPSAVALSSSRLLLFTHTKAVSKFVTSFEFAVKELAHIRLTGSRCKRFATLLRYIVNISVQKLTLLFHNVL